MHRRILLGSTFLALTVPARAVETWSLITPDEFARDRAAPQVHQTRGLPQPGAPSIVVDQPAADTPLRAPLTFRLRFVAEAGAAINAPSLRASYGMLGLDITSRLLEHAKLTAQSLAAENVNIPAGTHTVTLSIADSAGRVGSRRFQFTVV
ncbi:MAG: hypothetical protein EXR07_19070 [Acetobacteraceae bacterium]|nr:hypothetical protein [Acetobacteraceae bacterium]